MREVTGQKWVFQFFKGDPSFEYEIYPSSRRERTTALCAKRGDAVLMVNAMKMYELLRDIAEADHSDELADLDRDEITARSLDQAKRVHRLVGEIRAEVGE